MFLEAGRRQCASLIVLAAGAVNSAALQLTSAKRHHARGLANSSDQVAGNVLMYDNAHVVAVELDCPNDVAFQRPSPSMTASRRGRVGHRHMVRRPTK